MTKISEQNALTGEQITRDMTETELAQLAADIETEKAEVKAAADKATAKAALLDRLGITADEAALLLG